MVTGIILASGFSKRMGKDKLLVELEGEKIIESVIKATINSKLDKVIIVYREDEVKTIADNYKVEAILNTEARLGQSESMKLGIENIECGSDYMFLMGDQPFISPDLINKLIYEYKKTEKNILIPYYNSKRGMPSIMGSVYREELLDITGDKGGRDIIDKYPEDVKIVYFKDEKAGIDIDTLDDLERIGKWI